MQNFLPEEPNDADRKMISANLLVSTLTKITQEGIGSEEEIDFLNNLSPFYINFILNYSNDADGNGEQFKNALKLYIQIFAQKIENPFPNFSRAMIQLINKSDHPFYELTKTSSDEFIKLFLESKPLEKIESRLQDKEPISFDVISTLLTIVTEVPSLDSEKIQGEIFDLFIKKINDGLLTDKIDTIPFSKVETSLSKLEKIKTNEQLLNLKFFFDAKMLSVPGQIIAALKLIDRDLQKFQLPECYTIVSNILIDFVPSIDAENSIYFFRILKKFVEKNIPVNKICVKLWRELQPRTDNAQVTKIINDMKILFYFPGFIDKFISDVKEQRYFPPAVLSAFVDFQTIISKVSERILFNILFEQSENKYIVFFSNDDPIVMKLVFGELKSHCRIKMCFALLNQYATPEQLRKNFDVIVSSIPSSNYLNLLWMSIPFPIIGFLSKKVFQQIMDTVTAFVDSDTNSVVEFFTKLSMKECVTKEFIVQIMNVLLKLTTQTPASIKYILTYTEKYGNTRQLLDCFVNCGETAILDFILENKKETVSNLIDVLFKPKSLFSLTGILKVLMYYEEHITEDKNTYLYSLNSIEYKFSGAISLSKLFRASCTVSNITEYISSLLKKPVTLSSVATNEFVVETGNAKYSPVKELPSKILNNETYTNVLMGMITSQKTELAKVALKILYRLPTHVSQLTAIKVITDYENLFPDESPLLCRYRIHMIGCLKPEEEGNFVKNNGIQNVMKYAIKSKSTIALSVLKKLLKSASDEIKSELLQQFQKELCEMLATQKEEKIMFGLEVLIEMSPQNFFIPEFTPLFGRIINSGSSSIYNLILKILSISNAKDYSECLISILDDCYKNINTSEYLGNIILITANSGANSLQLYNKICELLFKWPPFAQAPIYSSLIVLLNANPKIPDQDKLFDFICNKIVFSGTECPEITTSLTNVLVSIAQNNEALLSKLMDHLKEVYSLKCRTFHSKDSFTQFIKMMTKCSLIMKDVLSSPNEAGAAHTFQLMFADALLSPKQVYDPYDFAQQLGLDTTSRNFVSSFILKLTNHFDISNHLMSTITIKKISEDTQKLIGETKENFTILHITPTSDSFDVCMKNYWFEERINVNDYLKGTPGTASYRVFNHVAPYLFIQFSSEKKVNLPQFFTFDGNKYKLIDTLNFSGNVLALMILENCDCEVAIDPRIKEETKQNIKGKIYQQLLSQKQLKVITDRIIEIDQSKELLKNVLFHGLRNNDVQYVQLARDNAEKLSEAILAPDNFEEFLLNDNYDVRQNFLDLVLDCLNVDNTTKYIDQCCQYIIDNPTKFVSLFKNWDACFQVMTIATPLCQQMAIEILFKTIQGYNATNPGEDIFKTGQFDDLVYLLSENSEEKLREIMTPQDVLTLFSLSTQQHVHTIVEKLNDASYFTIVDSVCEKPETAANAFVAISHNTKLIVQTSQIESKVMKEKPDEYKVKFLNHLTEHPALYLAQNHITESASFWCTEFLLSQSRDVRLALKDMFFALLDEEHAKSMYYTLNSLLPMLEQIILKSSSVDCPSIEFFWVMTWCVQKGDLYQYVDESAVSIIITLQQYSAMKLSYDRPRADILHFIAECNNGTFLDHVGYQTLIECFKEGDSNFIILDLMRLTPPYDTNIFMQSPFAHGVIKMCFDMGLQQYAETFFFFHWEYMDLQQISEDVWSCHTYIYSESETLVKISKVILENARETSDRFAELCIHQKIIDALTCSENEVFIHEAVECLCSFIRAYFPLHENDKKFLGTSKFELMCKYWASCIKEIFAKAPKYPSLLKILRSVITMGQGLPAKIAKQIDGSFLSLYTGDAFNEAYGLVVDCIDLTDNIKLIAQISTLAVNYMIKKNDLRGADDLLTFACRKLTDKSSPESVRIVGECVNSLMSISTFPVSQEIVAMFPLFKKHCSIDTGKWFSNIVTHMSTLSSDPDDDRTNLIEWANIVREICSSFGVQAPQLLLSSSSFDYIIAILSNDEADKETLNMIKQMYETK